MKRFTQLVAVSVIAAVAVAVYSMSSGAASTTEPYDVNNDGAVTIADAIGCLSSVGDRGTPIPCDVDVNGAVTIGDVLGILAKIGPPPASPTSPASSSSTPTRTPTATATRTPVPPTNTPTRTPVPPTSTPTRPPSPTSTAPATGLCTVTSTSLALDAEEQAFLTLINAYRASNGAPALVVSTTLTKSSAWKSSDMGTNGYFAHDDLSRTWDQRIRDCGYTASGYIGENIAAGYTTAQAVFDAWRNSPGHNANMMNANYRAIGIGREYIAGSLYGWYWTTDFGATPD